MTLSGRIGQYEIEAEIGRGAMGEVYRARDTKMFDRPVAIKILAGHLTDTGIAHSRFRLEVEVAAKLTHPNIVTIFDQGTHESRPYFVMEFLDGFDLRHLIQNPGERSLRDRLKLAIQVCEGLDHAHERGVVHRDLKPANIMVTRRAGRDEAKLVDFGIVHVDESDLTRETGQPGTFNYMAPEQMDASPVTSQSDLFSLGIVLCELFSGTHPFRGANNFMTASRILSGNHEPIGDLLPDDAKDLETILVKCLERDPEQRPSRAAEISIVLQSVLLPLQAAETDPGTAPREGKPEEDAEGFIDRQILSARSDLELGRLDEARELLVEALKRDATNPRARRMFDRILQIGKSKVAYRDYFKCLRSAREALADGDCDAARDLCRRARELWEEDFEWRGLERDIEARTDPGRGRDAGSATTAPALGGPSAGATPAGSSSSVDSTVLVPPDDARRADGRRRRFPVIGWVAVGVLLVGAAVAYAVIYRSDRLISPDVAQTPAGVIDGDQGRPQAEPTPGPVVDPAVDPAVDSATIQAPVETLEETAVEPAPDPAPPPRPVAKAPAVSGGPARLATLSIVTSPPGATVRIDGQAVGTAPLEGVLHSAGRVRLSLALPGHVTLEMDVDLGAGEQMRVRQTLSPLVTTLTVETRPAGASIYLDDTYVGVSPLRDHTVAPGQHRVRAEHEGHQTRTELVRVAAGRSNPVNLPLTREPAPSVAETTQSPATATIPTTTPPSLPTPSAPTPAPVEPDPTPATSEAPPPTLSDLWFTANRQKEQESFDSLTQTLDRILSLSPADETARKWRNRVGKWTKSQNEELLEVVEEMIEDFRAYLHDRELKNLERQWGNSFDPETDRYFTRLFTEYQGAVRSVIGDLTVENHDGVADFEVQITIRAKRTRGRSIDYEVVDDYTWTGRVEIVNGNYIFTLPFP